MENIIKGKEANATFIESIEKRITKLFEDAKPYTTTSNAEDVIEKIDDENYIKKEDKEEFDILMTLLSYVEYKEEPKENVYEFKGLEYKEGDKTVKTSIFVSKENALKISRLANDYEDKLKRSNANEDMKMSIKFPIELLMLKYQGQNLPGLDYGAPEPKLASQTDDEYDASLKTYYDGHGVETKADETTEYREPYPHEKFNYRVEPAEATSVVQNGYYTERVAEIAENALGAEHGDPGLEPDEEQPIVGTDRGLGRKLGDAILTVKNIFKSKELPKKICKWGVLGVLGYTAVSCLVTNPAVTLLIAGGVTVVAGGARLIFPKVKKGINAIKKKVKEWLFGPELTQNPPTGRPPVTNPPTGGTEEEPEEPTPTEETETLSVEEINDRIAELQTEITEIKEQQAQLSAQIESLPDGEEKIQKIAELKKLLAKEKVRTLEVASLLHQYDLEHNAGGPRL